MTYFNTCYNLIQTHRKDYDEIQIEASLKHLYNKDKTIYTFQLERVKIEIDEYKYNALLKKLQNIAWIIDDKVSVGLYIKRKLLPRYKEYRLWNG